MSLQKDIDFGCKKEVELFDTLCSKFGDLVQCDDKYSKFDFYNDKYEIELKSRRNARNTYPTTMIASDKYSRYTDKKIVFVFCFTDGIYYIKYKHKQFKKYEKKLFKRSRPGHYDVQKEYVYIPVSDLKKL